MVLRNDDKDEATITLQLSRRPMPENNGFAKHLTNLYYRETYCFDIFATSQQKKNVVKPTS